MLSPFVEYMSCSLNSGAITSIKFNPKGNQIGVATSVGHLFIFNKGFFMMPFFDFSYFKALIDFN